VLLASSSVYSSEVYNIVVARATNSAAITLLTAISQAKFSTRTPSKPIRRVWADLNGLKVLNLARAAWWKTVFDCDK